MSKENVLNGLSRYQRSFLGDLALHTGRDESKLLSDMLNRQKLFAQSLPVGSRV